MKNSVRVLVAAATFAAAAGSAGAATIGFDNIFASEGNGTMFGMLDGPIVADGFNFTTESGHGHVITSASTCDGGCADNGTQYLGGDTTNVVMSAANGAAFSVYSFDAAQAFYNLFRPSTILVEGSFARGGTTSAYFTLADKDFSTISLSGFEGLSSLTFRGADAEGLPGSLWIGVDNIALSPVPEPEMGVLMVAGLAGMGAFVRRRQPKHAVA